MDPPRRVRRGRVANAPRRVFSSRGRLYCPMVAFSAIGSAIERTYREKNAHPVAKLSASTVGLRGQIGWATLSEPSGRTHRRPERSAARVEPMPS